MGLKTLIFNLVRIYMPLLLAIALIMVFTPAVGVIAGISMSLAAGIYELWRYKKINIFLLGVICAILLTGVIFYLIGANPIDGLLPLFLELVIILVLAFMNHKERFVNEILINRRQGKVLITHTFIELYAFYLRALLFFLATHLISSFALFTLNFPTLYKLSLYVGFPSTLALYGIFAIVHYQYTKKKLDNEEWLTVVDAKGGVKGKATRKHCHGEEKLMHPVVHLHLIKGNSIFLQKRSEHKTVQPGKWDTAVGGHISFGEDVETGLLREAKEELGLTNISPRFLLKYVWETDIEKELVYMFFVKDIEEITINKSELDDGKYWSVAQIRENLDKNVFTPNFEKEFELLQNIFF